MTPTDIKSAIRAIGLALNASHNTVTTDMIDVEPDETHWRIDHSKELELLEKISRYLGPNNDTCLVCDDHNKSL